VRVVLVIDVPRGLEGSAADAARLADEFGRTLPHFIPGVRARKAVVSTTVEPPARTGLTVDLASRRVDVDGRPIRLAYREFQLLAYLAAKPHHTVSRTTLLRNVWSDRRPGAEAISDRTVDSHIRRLRAKLGAHAHVLVTVRGHGYRFDPSADVLIGAEGLRRPANQPAEIPTRLSRTLGVS
jgi:DNA-binding winged helix-turn-helix (wHTH) protein